MTDYYNYIIYNENGNTYNGYTTNLSRRLKQHNGVIKGGARYTNGKGPWKYLMILYDGDWTSISDAKKVEWNIRYPTRRKPRPPKYNGINGRILSIYDVCNNYYDDHQHINMKCYIDATYISLIPSNFVVNGLIEYSFSPYNIYMIDF